MKVAEVTGDWYADPGDKWHMSGNAMLSRLKNQKITNWITKGVGEKRPTVKGTGFVYFITFIGDKLNTGILKDALYVPNLGINLVSLGSATEKHEDGSFVQIQEENQQGYSILATKLRKNASRFCSISLGTKRCSREKQ